MQIKKDDAQRTFSEWESVKDLMHLVSNASTIFRTYPPKNQIYITSAQRLAGRFSDHLDQYNDISLTVGQYEIMFNDQKVYSENNPSRSLALKLYRDGIRQICFQKGLEEKEIVSFVEVLSNPYTPENLEKDIVTTLWEMDLSHIKYIVQEEIFTDTKNPLSEGEGAEASQSKTLKEENNKVETTPVIKHEYKDIRTEIIDIAQEVKAFLGTMNEQAVKRLQNNIQLTIKSDIFIPVASIVFDIVTADKEPELMESAVKLLGNLIRVCITKRHLQNALDILVMLENLANSGLALSEKERQRAKEELNILNNSEILQELIDIGNKDIPEYDQWLREFLVSWGESAIGVAITLAGQVLHNGTILEALLELGRKYPDLYAQRLNDNDPKTVLLMLKILGQLGNAGIVPYLKECIRHPKTEIKIETIRTVMKLGGENAFDILKIMFDDEDPWIRCGVLQTMGNLGHPKTFNFLKEKILDKTFISNSMEEKRALLKAFVKVGGEETISILENMIRNKRWFCSEKHDEIRACSAYALGLTKRMDAHKILEDFMSDRSQKVQAACRAALSRFNSSNKEKVGS